MRRSLPSRKHPVKSNDDDDDEGKVLGIAHSQPAIPPPTAHSPRAVWGASDGTLDALTDFAETGYMIDQRGPSSSSAGEDASSEEGEGGASAGRRRRGRPSNPSAAGDGTAALAGGASSSYDQLLTLLTKSQLYSQFIEEQVALEAELQSLASGTAESGSATAVGNSAPQRPTATVDDNDDIPLTKRSFDSAAEQQRRQRHHQWSPFLAPACVLFPHQMEGCRWLCSLYANGVNGILADEMGLGKTLQIIAFLAKLIESGVIGPHLVIVPLSTLSNWKAEFARWLPDMPLLVYHGKKGHRATCRRWLRQRSKDIESYESKSHRKTLRPAEMLDRFGAVVLASYEMILADNGALKGDDFRWNCMVVDEGHRLKNFECHLIRTLRQFQCEGRILLTGTPLQNKLSELWSILNFILPDVFSELRQFEQWFAIGELDSSDDDEDEATTTAATGQAAVAETPVVAASPTTAAATAAIPTPTSEAQQKVGGEVVPAAPTPQRLVHIVAKMHQVLRPFMLRRVKSEVVEVKLPPKYEVVIRCPLFPEQGKQYEIVRKAREYSNGRMVHLRKVCCHPHLFSQFDPFHEAVAAEAIVERVGCEKYLSGLLAASSKLNLLDKMLSLLHQEGHRVLIFSQLTMVLDLIEDYLMYRGTWKYERIDGTKTREERTESLRSFQLDNSDIFVFLLSTRAGGLGVNLTSADTVILYDCDFNPHNDLQAIDRCHRIGQTKPVVVYRLVCPGTVEDEVYKISLRKIRMEKLLIGEGRFNRKPITRASQSAAQLGSASSGNPSSPTAPNNGGPTSPSSSSREEDLLLSAAEARLAKEEVWVQQDTAALEDAVKRIRELRYGDLETLSAIDDLTLRWLMCDRRRIGAMCDARRVSSDSNGSGADGGGHQYSAPFEVL